MAPAKVMLFAKIVVDVSSTVPAKIVPLLKEIGPEISLLPLNVIIPDPEYANPPLPLNLPEKVFVPEPLIVRTLELATSKLPASANDAAVILSSKSNSAPLSMIRSVDELMLPPEANCKIPSVTLVSPV